MSGGTRFMVVTISPNNKEHRLVHVCEGQHILMVNSAHESNVDSLRNEGCPVYVTDHVGKLTYEMLVDFATRG